MSALPEFQFTVRCLADGVALPGGWVEVAFRMAHRNDYRSCHGPADESGAVIVDTSLITPEVDRQLTIGLMDYVDFSAGWTHEVVIHPLGIRRATEELAEYNRLRQWLGFPEGYGPGLADLLERLDLIRGARLAAEITAASDGMTFVLPDEKNE